MDELNAKKIRTIKRDDKPIGMIVWNGGYKLDFYTPNGEYKDFQVISHISYGGAKKNGKTVRHFNEYVKESQE